MLVGGGRVSSGEEPSSVDHKHRPIVAPGGSREITNGIGGWREGGAEKKGESPRGQGLVIYVVGGVCGAGREE